MKIKIKRILSKTVEITDIFVDVFFVCGLGAAVTVFGRKSKVAEAIREIVLNRMFK